MEPMKNLCGLIPESLHKRLMEGKSPEITNGEYLTKILTTYLDQPATAKQEQRTLAVQISDDMLDVYKRQMQMSGAAEQLTLFDLDICAGRMYQDHSVQRAAKISASSSRLSLIHI